MFQELGAAVRRAFLQASPAASLVRVLHPATHEPQVFCMKRVSKGLSVQPDMGSLRGGRSPNQTP